MKQYSKSRFIFPHFKSLLIFALIAFAGTGIIGGFILINHLNSTPLDSNNAKAVASYATLTTTIVVNNPSSSYNIVIGQKTNPDAALTYSNITRCLAYSGSIATKVVTCSVSPQNSTITMGVFVLDYYTGAVVSQQTRSIVVTTIGSDRVTITLPGAVIPTPTKTPTPTIKPTTIPTQIPSSTPTPIAGFGINSNGLRDKYKWPFASNSIWNTPIGSGAVFQSAGIVRNYTDNYNTRFTVDQDVIIMKPTEPRISIKYSTAAWGGDRCQIYGDTFPSGASGLTVPIPSSYTLASSKENNAMAALLSDGSTVSQFVAFARCSSGGNGTAFRNFSNVSIYGDGISGSHGGSGLSAIGGTIRYGEFTKGTIRHALKINLYSKDYYYSGCVPKWPATVVDNYCSGTYKGTLSSRTPGALLALKSDFNISGLRTTPGKIIAQALMDYGAYIVDDSKWNGWAIAVEQGPDGKVVDEFKSLYSYSPILDSDTLINSAFGLDMKDVFQSLNIVTNNSASSIGGGGTPRKPLAPAIGN